MDYPRNKVIFVFEGNTVVDMQLSPKSRRNFAREESLSQAMTAC
jgi:hypothetical protein